MVCNEENGEIINEYFECCGKPYSPVQNRTVHVAKILKCVSLKKKVSHSFPLTLVLNLFNTRLIELLQENS